MTVHPLRPATRRRLGRPLPHQQADRPRAHPQPLQTLSTTPPTMWSYPVLDPVSQAYPGVEGRSPTCYSPVRHSSTSASTGLSVRLACVKHAASVHPEPGSNSPQKNRKKRAVKSPKPDKQKTDKKKLKSTKQCTPSNLPPAKTIIRTQGPGRSTPTGTHQHHLKAYNPGSAGGQATRNAPQKVHQHTIEFSHNTSTPGPTPF